MDKPLYATFLEHHARALADPLRDVEVRKVASALTTLSNEKQKEQRDKASGKKKPKATAKPALGAAKPSSKCVFLYRGTCTQGIDTDAGLLCRIDTKIYDEALDDFGDDNFM